MCAHIHIQKGKHVNKVQIYTQLMTRIKLNFFFIDLSKLFIDL